MKCQRGSAEARTRGTTKAAFAPPSQHYLDDFSVHSAKQGDFRIDIGKRQISLGKFISMTSIFLSLLGKKPKCFTLGKVSVFIVKVDTVGQGRVQQLQSTLISCCLNCQSSFYTSSWSQIDIVNPEFYLLKTLASFFSTFSVTSLTGVQVPRYLI